MMTLQSRAGATVAYTSSGVREEVAGQRCRPGRALFRPVQRQTHPWSSRRLRPCARGRPGLRRSPQRHRCGVGPFRAARRGPRTPRAGRAPGPGEPGVQGQPALPSGRESAGL